MRDLGRVDYRETCDAMRAQAAARDNSSADEFWLVEHAQVYTLGLKMPAPTETTMHGIPVIKTDRGGDITYHGPGQAIVYLLLDLSRRGLSVRRLVCLMEEAVLALLDRYGVSGQRREGAPGIYVDNAKIASLGLRVRRGRTYHGIALNIDVDLTPFSYIKPCGLDNVTTTRLIDLVPDVDPTLVRQDLLQSLADTLGYGGLSHEPATKLVRAA